MLTPGRFAFPDPSFFTGRFFLFVSALQADRKAIDVQHCFRFAEIAMCHKNSDRLETCKRCSDLVRSFVCHGFAMRVERDARGAGLKSLCAKLAA